jgi:hypothetical protein
MINGYHILNALLEDWVRFKDPVFKGLGQPFLLAGSFLYLVSGNYNLLRLRDFKRWDPHLGVILAE